MYENWISSHGGPFAIMPVDLLPKWTGATGAEKIDDYDNACTIDDYLGTIKFHGFDLIILGDAPFDTKIMKTNEGVILARWICGDSRNKVESHLTNIKYSKMKNENINLEAFFCFDEYILFDTAISGMDAMECESENKAYRSDIFTLKRGNHNLQTFHFSPDEKTSLIIHTGLVGGGCQ